MCAMRVTVLGSGGGIPRVGRNLPGILIEASRYRILVDPSEGSVARLESVGVSPLRLTHIYISHLHADHVNGLPGLLATMLMLDRVTQLTIAGPTGIGYIVDKLAGKAPFEIRVLELGERDSPSLVEDLGDLEVRYVTTYHTVQNNSFRFSLKRPVGRFNPEKAKALNIPVQYWKRLHMGESVTLPDGRVIQPSMVLDSMNNTSVSVTYTGDTAPGESLIKLASGTTLLIHDSTYLPSHANEAKSRGHSTCMDAARDALEAGVGYLALFHISYRYGREDDWAFVTCASSIFKRTLLARDGSIYEIS